MILHLIDCLDEFLHSLRVSHMVTRWELRSSSKTEWSTTGCLLSSSLKCSLQRALILLTSFSRVLESLLTHTHTHTHNRFMAFLDFVQHYPGELAPEKQNQEGKTNLDLLEQEIVSGWIGLSRV